MKNLLVLVVIAAICVTVIAVLYVGGRDGKTAARGETILPGIEAEFTEDEDAGECYARMIKSFLGRKTGGENPKSLTDDERRWFMLGTSCRRCNLYPEQFPHIMPYTPMPELPAAKDVGVIMAHRARSLWRRRRDREALDILTRVAVLGWHIEREDECLMSNLAGINIQWVAYDYLSRFYEARVKTEKAEEYQGYIEARRKSLSRWYEVTTPLKTLSDFERIKKIALADSDPLWRREAYFQMTDAFVLSNPQLRAHALQLLRSGAQNDPDPKVQQWAAACIPYVLGTKKAPQ